MLSTFPITNTGMLNLFNIYSFVDMRAERNKLMKNVIPRLKTFCSERDLDFQAVDMRWGVTDDCTNDHSVEKLCLLEVENCQKISLGPNFVVNICF